jgi:hypothetical protein
MQRREFAGAVLGGAALFGRTAFGCGDHLLVIGRGVRFQHAYAKHRGNLVIYSAENQSGGNSKSNKLQATLKQAGHKLRAVQGAVQLDQALKLERVDVVLADFSDLGAITGELQSAPSRPVVLPVLFKPSKAEFAAAQKEYKFVLKAPVDEIQLLTAIDEAMKYRLKIGSKI